MANVLGGLKSAEQYAKATPQLAKLKQATDGLEAFMFKNLLSTIKKSSGGPFGKGAAGSEIYKDLFDQTLSDTMAKRGALGISDTIYNKVAPLAIANEAINQLQKSNLSNKEANKK